MEGKAAPAPEVGQASSSQQPQAITGTSSQAAANPEAAPLQLIQPGHQPPIFEGELPPLTQRQEKSLARALNYQAEMEGHVQRIFWENGRELTPDESSYFRDLLIADLDTELNLRKLRERAQQLIKYGARAKAFKKAKRVFDNEDIWSIELEEEKRKTTKSHDHQDRHRDSIFWEQRKLPFWGT